MNLSKRATDMTIDQAVQILESVGRSDLAALARGATDVIEDHSDVYLVLHDDGATQVGIWIREI